jgi:hypothetical protein
MLDHMRNGVRLRVLLVCSLLLTLAAAAQAKRVAAPRKPPPPPPQDKPVEKPKPAPPKSNSYWEPLATAGNRWVFRPEKESDPPSYIVVDVYDVREVKGAKVARLKWTLFQGASGSPMGNSLPTQIAVTKKGAWLLTDKLDDAGVAKAIKGKPHFADPPKAFKGDDGYVRKDGDNVCVGVGTPPGGTCATGVCHAEYCLAKGVGLTSIAGNYTPTAGVYTAPKPNEIPAEMRTGVPACDKWLVEYYRCVQTSTIFDDASRREILSQLVQVAQMMRQQVAGGNAAQIAEANRQCEDMAQYMPQMLQSLGCAP